METAVSTGLSDSDNRHRLKKDDGPGTASDGRANRTAFDA